jgi:hypothetical protein
VEDERALHERLRAGGSGEVDADVADPVGAATRAPSLASNAAPARPMPAEAPVTNTTVSRSARSIIWRPQAAADHRGGDQAQRCVCSDRQRDRRPNAPVPETLSGTSTPRSRTHCKSLTWAASCAFDVPDDADDPPEDGAVLGVAARSTGRKPWCCEAARR